MSFDDQDDLELQDEVEEVDPTDEEPEDPLADLDEDTRAVVNAVLEQRVQEQFKELQKGYTKRFTAAQRDLEAKGLIVDGDGRISVRDPERFVGFAGQFAGQPQQPETKQEPAKQAIPDPTFDPAGFEAWANRQAEVKARELIAPLEGVIAQQQLGAATEEVRSFLGTLGVEHLADEEAFQQSFRQALSTVPLQQRNTPQAIRAAAGMALGVAGEALTKPKPKAAAPTARDANRQLLTQVGASRGAGTSPNDRGYTEEEIMLAQHAGMTPAQWRAAGEDPYGDALRRLNQKGGKR